MALDMSSVVGEQLHVRANFVDVLDVRTIRKLNLASVVMEPFGAFSIDAVSLGNVQVTRRCIRGGSINAQPGAEEN